MHDIDTRTMPMEDSLKFVEEGPAGIFCDFQPGNGTRYLIGLTPFSEYIYFDYDYPKTRKSAGGVSEEGWLLTWLNKSSGGRCCVLEPEGYLAPGLLKERLGGTMADAIVLSRLVAHLTARETDSWEPHRDV
jgi:hypothetical protein